MSKRTSGDEFTWLGPIFLLKRTSGDEFGWARPRATFGSTWQTFNQYLKTLPVTFSNLNFLGRHVTFSNKWPKKILLPNLVFKQNLNLKTLPKIPKVPKIVLNDSVLKKNLKTLPVTFSNKI